jgi:hypothetical protein
MATHCCQPVEPGVFAVTGAAGSGALKNPRLCLGRKRTIVTLKKGQSAG